MQTQELSNQRIEDNSIKQAYQRERTAREKAERLLEEKIRELDEANKVLDKQFLELQDHAFELQFLHDLALIDKDNFCFEIAMQKFLDSMCQRCNWLFGHIYVPVAEDSSKLSVSGIISSVNFEKASEFCELMDGIKLDLGEKLPGRVYESQSSEWVEDLVSDTNNPRSSLYKKLDIQAAFALPIKVYGEIVAICEFFADRRKKAQLNQIKFTETAALQIGNTIEKYQALEKIKEEKNKFALAHSRMQYLIDNTPAIIYTSVASGDFKITSISANIRIMLGYSQDEVIDDPDFWFNHIHEDDRNHIFMQLPKLWQTGEQVHEYRFQKKDGSYLWMHDTLRLIVNEDKSPKEIIGSLVDISSQKELEVQLKKEKQEQLELNSKLQETQNQLVQSEKMASLGQLAAGVAHEINNPVGFVMSNLGTLNDYVLLFKKILGIYDSTKELVEENNNAMVLDKYMEIDAIYKDEDIDFVFEDSEQLVSESIEGIDRVKEIVHQLKCFSHVDQASVKPSNINDCLENTLKVVWNEIKYKAEVIKDFGEIPEIKCNPAELNQVFMNLLVNAGHSIKERGEISVKTQSDGTNIIISISDSGHGIDEEHLEKLFDPFFTTKPVGEGTGLGLSISYGIVEKHKGTIEVTSEIGVGTTFTIRLPLVGLDEES